MVEEHKQQTIQLELLKQEKSNLISQITAQESVIDGLKAERKIWGQELAEQGKCIVSLLVLVGCRLAFLKEWYSRWCLVGDSCETPTAWQWNQQHKTTSSDRRLSRESSSVWKTFGKLFSSILNLLQLLLHYVQPSRPDGLAASGNSKRLTMQKLQRGHMLRNTDINEEQPWHLCLNIKLL